MSGCHSESLYQFLVLLISPWSCPLLPNTVNCEYYELFLTSQWWRCLVTKSYLTCDPIDCSLPCSTLSMGFPRQEYWSGLPFPSPGDLPKPGIEPTSLVSPLALAGGFFTSRATEETLFILRSSTCWRRKWHPNPVLWPRKFHGWRSLVGCSPWGR